MNLSEELGLRNALANPSHEALLNIYHAASQARKRSAEFFHSCGVTDVQFNLMMLLRHQCDAYGGLSQVELSRMMLVNRANITAIIDRMEKAGLVVRSAVPGDRRSKSVHLTERGGKLLNDIEGDYRKEVRSIMDVLGAEEVEQLIRMLEKIRANLKQGNSTGSGRKDAF
jgi:DNA-binding MarR family transcriptional regulator